MGKVKWERGGSAAQLATGAQLERSDIPLEKRETFRLNDVPGLLPE
jgi:hypothetical protein